MVEVPAKMQGEEKAWNPGASGSYFGHTQWRFILVAQDEETRTI
jgi:hypothetical protein